MRRLFPLVALIFAVFAAAAPVPVGALPAVEKAKHAPYRERLTGGGVAFDMVAVPGGEFLLGSPDREKGRDSDEGPRRRVKVRPFWMGKTEVTWELFYKFLKRDEADVDGITRPTPPYHDETHGFGRDGYPAIGMSHHGAMEFCRWLSKVTGKAYRLPLEAEWEWACRAGTATAYHFGDDEKKLGDFAWFAANSNESSHPVGKKKPNAWGLYDMHGNVAEWCLDHYAKDAYASDKLRLPTADRFPHVVRGGSWFHDPAKCRCAARIASGKSWNKIDPGNPQSIWWVANTDFVGLRVVRAVEEVKDLKGLRSKVTTRSK
jgi:formylglycine-generating enzyme required for sulfatase activity